METVKFDVAVRDSSGAANVVRKNKMIPGVVYGKSFDPVSVQMDYQDFRRLYIKHGYSQVLDLNIEGKGTEKALVQDIQFHPVSGSISHVDFIKVNMKEEITSTVPVEVVGVAPAVKDHGGLMNLVMNEIEIKCLPGDMPHSIEVDVSGLENVGDSIHVSDLKISDKVKITSDLEGVVLNVAAPREEVEEEPVATEGEEGAEGGETAEEAAPAEEAKGDE